MARSNTRGRSSQTSRDQPETETPQSTNRPTRSSTRKGKAVASSSAPAEPETEPETKPRSLTYPWPRPDDTPFTDPEWNVAVIPQTTMKEVEKTPMYQNYKHGTHWARHHCLFYNGLHRVDVTPTRFVCPHTLRKMGIEEEVRQMLQSMGMGTMAYQTYPLYPELVRQFLASAELRFESAALPSASEATLSFFSSGKYYEITIRDLCRLYGFDPRQEYCRFTSRFDQVVQLWNLIGHGTYESRSAKITHIRSPVIRVVAKILGSTLFGKDESGAVRKDELQMIHFGLPPFISDIYSHSPPDYFGTNLGAIFAEILTQKKTRGLNTLNRKFERIGSLITPIFRHCGIDLASAYQEPKIAFFDEQFFKNCGILKAGYMYQFVDQEDVVQRCQLPLRDFAYLASRESIAFSIHPEQPQQGPTRQRGSSSAAASTQPHLEDDRVPDEPFPQQSQGDNDMEFALPPYMGQYAPPPPPAASTEMDRWIIETHTRAHSMMERIWGGLARIRCPRPPACFRGEDATHSQTRRGQDADIPDVAGHGTTDVADADDHSDPDSRLQRRRRQPGQSHSDSSADR